jgi:hypothetical protein
MEQDTANDLEQFADSERRKLRAMPKPQPGLTRLGSEMSYFRNMPYPASPEREAEIDRLHRQEQKRLRDEYRSNLIAFAAGCVDGKRGHAAQELADEVFRTVERIDLLDAGASVTPENCCNLVLWDLRRRVAWMNAKARGEVVPDKLRTREECLANHNARKFADERFADNDPVSRIPPAPNYGYNPPHPATPEQQTIGDWAKDSYG